MFAVFRRFSSVSAPREDSGADGSDATSPRSEHLLPCSTQDLEQRGSSCSGLFELLLSLL